MKYGDLNLGQIEAMVNKLGGMEGVKKFLRGELIISKSGKNWREENGIIYLTVTSDGTTGEDWISRLEKKGFKVGDYAKSLLRSNDFKPSSGITTEIAILKGMLWNDSDRTTEKIRAYATEHQLSTPNAEVACLIRENFSDKEIGAMGFYWIVVMHEPIKGSDGGLELLSTGCYGDGPRLTANYDGLDRRGWHRVNGFAFVFSQVSSS